MHHLRRAANNLRVFTLVLCSHPTHGGLSLSQQHTSFLSLSQPGLYTLIVSHSLGANLLSFTGALCGLDENIKRQNMYDKIQFKCILESH